MGGGEMTNEYGMANAVCECGAPKNTLVEHKPDCQWMNEQRKGMSNCRTFTITEAMNIWPSTYCYSAYSSPKAEMQANLALNEKPDPKFMSLNDLLKKQRKKSSGGVATARCLSFS
jgi:hypothetical protein